MGESKASAIMRAQAGDACKAPPPAITCAPPAFSESNIKRQPQRDRFQVRLQDIEPAGVAAYAVDCAARPGPPAGGALAGEQRQDGQAMRVGLAISQLRF